MHQMQLATPMREKKPNKMCGKTKEKWFEGPWQVIHETSMSQVRRLKPGDIMKHSTGTVLLNCPACNSLQFAKAQVIGTDVLPSLDKPIQCGAGFCRKCGEWFRVIDGKSVKEEPSAKTDVRIPDKLIKAGVTKPPNLAEQIRKVREAQGR